MLAKTSMAELKQLETVNEALLFQRLEVFSETTQRLAINPQLVVPLKLNVTYQLQAFLDILLKQNSLQTLAVLHPDGQVGCTAGLAVAGYKIDLSSEIEKARARKTHARYGLDKDGQVVEMGFVSIRQADSEIGILFSSRALSLNEVFSRTLVVSDGVVASRSPYSFFLLAHVDTILNEASGSEHLSLNKNRISVLCMTIPGVEMTAARLIAGIDQTEEYLKRDMIMLLAGLAGLAIVILIVGYSSILSEKLTGPILQIADVASQVAAGQEGVQWLEHQEGEVGILNHTLKGMTENLQAANHELLETLEKAEDNRQQAEHFSVELQRLNESLEETICERTEDLIHAKETAS